MKNNRAAALIAATVLTAATITATPAQAHNGDHTEGVTITSAWVRASEWSDHVGGMTGIFAKITNHTKHTVVLVGGNTALAPVVQTHAVANGMMVEKKGGISIKPGATVTLQLGGLHVMLMNLKSAILPGDKFMFQFKFRGAKAQRMVLTARVAQAGDETYNNK